MLSVVWSPALQSLLGVTPPIRPQHQSAVPRSGRESPLKNQKNQNVTVGRGLATETLHRGGVGPWGPLARPAQEHKGPANAAPSVPHHTRFSFACSPLTRFRFKFQSAPAAHFAPTFAPATHIAAATTNPAFASIHGRYPAIDPLYLKEILENRFQPENIIKLSTLFSPSPRRRETVTLYPIIQKYGDSRFKKRAAKVET
jgi:hypothetical protein